MTNKSTLPYLKLLFAVFAWGGSFIATKVAVKQISPTTLIWLRFTIGILILGFTVYRRKEFKLIPVNEIIHFAFLGFIGISFHQWLQSTGLLTSEASTTAWIVATTPIFIALLGWIVLKEKMRFSAILGILLAATGVILVVSKGDFSFISDGLFKTKGDIYILVSAVNWAVFSILSRHKIKTYPSSLALFYIMAFGLLFTSIAFVAEGAFHEIYLIDINGWYSILFLGIGATGLAYIAWFDGLKSVPAAKAGSFIYLEPLVAIFLSFIFLGELLTFFAILGGLLILNGVWIVTYSKKVEAIPDK